MDGSRESGHTHRWKENGASGDRQKQTTSEGRKKGREEGDREGNKVTMVLGDDAKSLHSSPLQMSPGEDENLHSVMGCFK